MQILSKDALNARINWIKSRSSRIDEAIHQAAVSALHYLNTPEIQDVGYAQRLVDALGKAHRRETLKAWFMHYGKCQLKDNQLVFLKRRDITPENFKKFIEDAEDKPFWTKQEKDATKQAREMDAEAEFIRLFKRLASAESVAHQELISKVWEVMPEYVKNKVMA